MLFLSQAKGFTLQGKGITLDGALDGTLKGKQSVKNLVLIYSYNAGLVLEDLQLRNFSQSGVLVINAVGDAAGPIRLANFQFTAPSRENYKAALFFDADPKTKPNSNDFIEVGECRFPGFPAEKTILVGKREKPVLGQNVLWPGKK